MRMLVSRSTFAPDLMRCTVLSWWEWCTLIRSGRIDGESNQTNHTTSIRVTYGEFEYERASPMHVSSVCVENRAYDFALHQSPRRRSESIGRLRRYTDATRVVVTHSHRTTTYRYTTYECTEHHYSSRLECAADRCG